MKDKLRVVTGEGEKVDSCANDIMCQFYGKLKLQLTVTDLYDVTIKYFREEQLEASKQLPAPIRFMTNVQPVYIRCVSVSWFERLLGITLKKKLAKAISKLKAEILRDDATLTSRVHEIAEFEGSTVV
jgi:hypothetical protein